MEEVGGNDSHGSTDSLVAVHQHATPSVPKRRIWRPCGRGSEEEENEERGREKAHRGRKKRKMKKKRKTRKKKRKKRRVRLVDSLVDEVKAGREMR